MRTLFDQPIQFDPIQFSSILILILILILFNSIDKLIE